jgi:hypothetical protein
MDKQTKSTKESKKTSSFPGIDWKNVSKEFLEKCIDLHKCFCTLPSSG